MSESWSAEAPSNIALIKYMGKTGKGNNPANISFSYTLPELRTRVEVTPLDSGDDQWQPLEKEGWETLSLSGFGRQRYMKFWSHLKETFSIQGNYLIKSSNNFPSDCGLASSASSFASLTQAAHRVFLETVNDHDWTASELANLSRQGSGSSCRSFFEPWAYWKPVLEGDDEIGALDLKCGELKHHVVVVEGEKKKISSSEAHKKVSSSLLYDGRVGRAEHRYQDLVLALNQGEWRQAFDITWAEFWDMHALFETSQPSFGYMTADTLRILTLLRELWDVAGDGPLITMDAGPNIHLLFRKDHPDLEQEVTELVKALGSE